MQNVTIRNILVASVVAGTGLMPALAAADESKMNEELVSRHLGEFGAGNMEGLLADYTNDAFLMTPNGTIRGKDELRKLFEGLFAEFGQEGVTFNLAHQSCDGNICQIVWDAETPDNSYEFATDTFVIEDGKIVAQTLAAKVTPKAK